MKIIKKIAEVCSIQITEFKQGIPVRSSAMPAIIANSDTIIFTFAGSGMSAWESPESNLNMI